MEECLVCSIVRNHKKEVGRILENAMKNPPEIDVETFRTTPICTIKTPNGKDPISLNDIEKIYTKSFPTWYQSFQCFPEGPMFYDKLFKKEPYTRAIDIENKFKELKKEIIVISEIPFDVETDADEEIITKTVTRIMQSFKVMITNLKITDFPRMENGVSNVLKGKVKGKLKYHNLSLEAINEIQNDAFYMIIDNDETCKQNNGYYNMR